MCSLLAPRLGRPKPQRDGATIGLIAGGAVIMSPEEKFWIEMSVREISTQAHFADLAYANFHPKAKLNNDAVFSSIHSFLFHCAMMPKMLRGRFETVSIDDVLDIAQDSIIHERKFRDDLEHYYSRLKNWIREYGLRRVIGTYNIGRRDKFRGVLLIKHYDPSECIFTFVGEDFDLEAMHGEAIRIKEIADRCINVHIEGRPPARDAAP
jgi:hypothetical protein